MQNIVAFALLTTSLLACAPASYQPGASSFTPLEAKSEKVNLSGPGVWFLKVPAKISVERAAGDTAFDGFYGYNDVSAGFKKTAAVTWVKLEDIKAPDGWKVELNRQEGTREVTSVRIEGNTKYYYYRDYMDVILSATIPNGTKPGQYVIVTNLKTLQAGNQGIATVLVDLVAPTTP
jgi:hypothetical protein